MRYDPDRDGSAAAKIAANGGELPFRIHRSRMGNLPLYSDIRNGGTKVVTIVKKYAGDSDALCRSLMEVCKSDVSRYHGRIEVKGRHKQTLTKWLLDLGF